jgi:3-isopropylmalate/(R)-2-methylmalate dehydratase small subunit
MKRFETISATAAVLPEANVDTDIIYPARYLLIPDRVGLGAYAFFDRRDRLGAYWDFSPISILIVGENFGCGSSREQAVWCLADLGVHVIVAPSFGEIFYNNCFKNGVLPIRLEPARYTEISSAAMQGEVLTVSLEACTITAGTRVHGFTVAAEQRQALLDGLDEIDLLLSKCEADISAFERQRRRTAPWAFLDQDEVET